MKIVRTDNFARDYIPEEFVNLPRMTEEHANKVAKAINDGFPSIDPWVFKVVSDNYILRGRCECESE